MWPGVWWGQGKGLVRGACWGPSESISQATEDRTGPLALHWDSSGLCLCNLLTSVWFWGSLRAPFLSLPWASESEGLLFWAVDQGVFSQAHV